MSLVGGMLFPDRWIHDVDVREMEEAAAAWERRCLSTPDCEACGNPDPGEVWFIHRTHLCVDTDACERRVAAMTGQEDDGG